MYLPITILYNNFFNPNFCHVCKRRFAGILVLCDRCYMISYCCEKHRLHHMPEHVEICESIRKHLVMKPHEDERRYSPLEWLILRKEFLRLIKIDLDRELKPYEIQMLMCRKSCLICHQQTELRTCEYCCSANWCKEHVKEFRKRHFSSCKKLNTLINVDIAAAQPFGAIIEMRFDNIPNDQIYYEDIASFISGYIHSARNTEYQEWIERDFICSDYLSGPLTVYHGMQEANLSCLKKKGSIIIHVIATDDIDTNGAAAWELLLHLMSNNIRMMTIIMIGPELSCHSTLFNACKSCQLDKRIIFYKYHRMLYHCYVKDTVYQAPDIIVGFQAELAYGKTWTESITALQAQNCPLLLTAASSVNARNDLLKIREVLSTNVTPIVDKLNKFVALRPYIDSRYDCVCYRNQYLMVYKDLHKSNEINSATS